jgi:hypothetical protein
MTEKDKKLLESIFHELDEACEVLVNCRKRGRRIIADTKEIKRMAKSNISMSKLASASAKVECARDILRLLS